MLSLTHGCGFLSAFSRSVGVLGCWCLFEGSDMDDAKVIIVGRFLGGFISIGASAWGWTEGASYWGWFLAAGVFLCCSTTFGND